MRAVQCQRAESRDESPVRPDRAADQPFARDAVQPAVAAVALPGGEHQREVPRPARLLKTLGERDQQRLGHRDPDEAPDRQRVAIEDQSGRLLGGDDPRALRGPSADS